MTPAQRASLSLAPADDRAHPGVVAFGLLAVLALGCALGWAARGEAAPRVETRTVREVVVEEAQVEPADHADPLADTLLAAHPDYLDAETAGIHARSARAAGAATGIDPAVLLGMAYVESRFNPAAMSWLDCDAETCRRRTGVWAGAEPPPRARPSWYCGALQVGGHVPWSSCLLMRDVPTVYVLASAHLVEWMGAPQCRRLDDDERLVCGLRGYNGGWAAIRGEAEAYPAAVMAAARRIR